MDDYAAYQDDFSEGEGANHEEDQNQRSSDGDDEQYAQKVNGKIEQLQRRVEDLEQELSVERQTGAEIRHKYEQELAATAEAMKNQFATEDASEKSRADAESLRAELQRYKKKLESLQEKYEMSLLTGNSNLTSLPLTLETELHSYIERHKIFPELQEKTLGASDCVTILKSLAPRKPRMASDSSLGDKLKGLEQELKTSTFEDVQQLKNKVFQLSERVRIEKEHKRQAEGEVALGKKKIAMLGDHMEKLVVHLKRESAHKLRLAEQLRTTERENSKFKERCELLAKKIAAKDRLLYELREGSKVLEDQLRLMDEKYLELRGKLDYSRSVASKKIKKAEKAAQELRVKFAMTNGSRLLDNMSMPDAFQSGMFSENEHGSVGSWPSLGLPSDHPRGLTPVTRGSRYNPTRSDMSQGSNKSEPSLDRVLEKIRMQARSRQEWTDDKIQQLLSGNK